MLVVKKVHSFVVSVVADLRPVVGGLNRELLSQGAEPVCREELPEVDRMLHEELGVHGSQSTRCPRCGGYIFTEAVGEETCLNCGRQGASRNLEDVIQKIAQGLIAQRHEWSSRPAGEAP